MSEQEQNIAVEELLAVVIASQEGRLEVPFEFFTRETILGKVIAVDHLIDKKVVVLSLADAEDMEVEDASE